MQIDLTNTEITMLILSTSTVADRFKLAWRRAENQTEAQQVQRRIQSMKALQEKLIQNLPQ